MVAGLGVFLMITALAIGVIQGSAADTSTVGLVFAAGLVLFLLGAGSWFAIVQPQKHFDDINQPAEAEPHGHADDHALAVTGEQHPEASGHSH